MHGRLGDSELAGGQGEVLGVADGDQRLQLRRGGGQLQTRRDACGGVVEMGERPLDPMAQELAERVGEQPSGGPLEQWRAYLTLELVQGLGDRGLRQVVLRGGLGYRPVRRDRQEDPEMTEIVGHPSAAPGIERGQDPVGPRFDRVLAAIETKLDNGLLPLGNAPRHRSATPRSATVRATSRISAARRTPCTIIRSRL